MRDDEVFADAFGAFFALKIPPVCTEPWPCTCNHAHTGEAYVNTIEEYRRSAEAGNRSAQEMLGLMYLYGSQLYGKGVARDLREAARWLELAAAQDSVLARQLLRRYVLSRTDRGLELPMPGMADCATARLGAAA